MSGVKGRSGGARKNAGGARPNSGGARPGAGRKPKPAPEPVAIDPDTDMLEFLQGVARGTIPAAPIQVRAAIAAVQYTHTKRGDGGKKEAADGRAQSAAKGRYGVRAGPLKVVGGNGRA